MKKQCPECKEFYQGVSCACGFRLMVSLTDSPNLKACEACRYTGFISAVHIKSRDCIRSYAFRCGCPKGQSLSARIPAWGVSWQDKGYRAWSDSAATEVAKLLKEKSDLMGREVSLKKARAVDKEKLRVTEEELKKFNNNSTFTSEPPSFTTDEDCPL